MDQKIWDEGNEDDRAGNLESREGAKQANAKQTSLTCLPPSKESVTPAPPTVQVEKGRKGQEKKSEAKERKQAEAASPKKGKE